jgi:hypothetical protein
MDSELFREVFDAEKNSLNKIAFFAPGDRLFTGLTVSGGLGVSETRRCLLLTLHPLHRIPSGFLEELCIVGFQVKGQAGVSFHASPTGATRALFRNAAGFLCPVAG